MLGFDTETLPITDHEQAPPLVCLSWYDSEVQTGGVLPPSAGIDFLLDRLARGQKVVAHNAAFDLGVLSNARPSAWKALCAALDNGQIECTQMRERLLRNAQGKLNRPHVQLAAGKVGADTLAGCAYTHLGVDLGGDKKQDSWRMRFGELRDLDVVDWPIAPREYAKGDAMWAVRVAQRQQHEARSTELNDAAARTRAAFSLRLLEARGIGVDEQAVDALERAAGAFVEEADLSLADLGFKEGDKKLGHVDKRLVEFWHDEDDKDILTGTGQTKTDRRTMLSLGYDGLTKAEQVGPWRTILQTFVPALRRTKNGVIHCDYQPLVSTGRISCRRPNLTNIPRSGGVRECLRPRPGYVFVACDLDSAEMRTLGQVLLDRFGKSKLAAAYQRDPHFDPHMAFALNLTTSREPKVLKAFRQRAKACNFGFPGGLGVDTFLSYALGYGVRLSWSEGTALKVGWFNQWPEMNGYFKENAKTAKQPGSKVVHARSGRIRGACTFTKLCNTPFQGMTADVALHALWEVTKLCYGEPSSVLYGSRVVIFVHDELVLEVPEEMVNEVVRELPGVMSAAAVRYVPDVPMTCQATAQYRWSKDAEHTVDKFGRIIPWAPQGLLAA